MAFLDEIIKVKSAEIYEAKKKRNIGDLKRMALDAPRLRSFRDSLSHGFGLIAEIKKKSPSAGLMRPNNVNEAAEKYDKCPVVNAVSVLTDSHYFGMSLNDLLRVKGEIRQPILRKDFILKKYQVYEARAYGADAVLLMANILSPHNMRDIYEAAREVGLDVLIEVRTEREIDSIPEGAAICGINSRKFMATKRWTLARWIAKTKMANRFWRFGKAPDPSVELSAFNIIKYLPSNVIKVAESGISPHKISHVRDLGFNAALVGTSLLTDDRGISAALGEFQEAILPRESREFSHIVETAAA